MAPVQKMLGHQSLHFLLFSNITLIGLHGASTKMFEFYSLDTRMGVKAPGMLLNGIQIEFWEASAFHIMSFDLILICSYSCPCRRIYQVSGIHTPCAIEVHFSLVCPPNHL